MQEIERAALGAALALCASWAMAQDDVVSSGSVGVGYVGTTGNTETQTYNLEVLYALPHGDWLHNLKFQALGSQENDKARAERYYLEDKSNWSFAEDDYLFGKATYNDDRFSGFDYQASVSAGYGHYFFNDSTLLLEGFGGAGYRENAIIDAGTDGEVIFSLGQNLKWNISPTSSVTQSLTSEIGDELTITRFEIGLVSNIIGEVATKIAFQARNTSKVPAGTEKTDTQTSVSLVYEF